MDCPRCGAETHGAVECPRCGVVVRKARPPLRRAPLPAPSSPSRRTLLLPGLALLALVLTAILSLRRVDESRSAVPPGPADAAPPSPAAAPEIDEPPPLRPLDPAAPDTSALAQDVPSADVAAAGRLVALLSAHDPLGSDDLHIAQDLFERHPEQAASLLHAVLLRLALQEQQAHRYDAAAALLERAVAVLPGNLEANRGLLAVRVAQADWAGAERAAIEVLADAPADAEATRSLAYALLRQDRTREAIEVLSQYLEGREDPSAAALLARIRHDNAAEAGLGEQTLSHFRVRYDGDAHEDVGREVLRVLERHYVTLTQTFGHQPAESIPVILFSRQSYYDATGAPAWSGGSFDSFDGRVRIPIGGLTTSLDPELDETILHELTHVFITDLSAGLAPREIQEGVAQLVAGHHGAARLEEAELRALANDRLSGVSDFYLRSLAFVEDLVAQRGQGGINDLLAAMRRSRSVDAAFREVYGKDMRALQTDAMNRLRQRYRD